MENQVELKLHGRLQLLIHAGDMNPLEDDLNTPKRNTEALIDASKEVGLEVNAEKTKYTLLSRHKNVEQNQNVKKANRSLQNVTKFKELGTTVIDTNFIQDEIKSRLN
jgi:hypothetical protein